MITRTLLVGKDDGTRKSLEKSGMAFRFFVFLEGQLVPQGGNVGWRKAQDLITLYLAMGKGKELKVERLQDGSLHENKITKDGVLVC